MEDEEIKQRRPHNKLGIGILLIAGGILLAVHRMGIVAMPAWIFSWPVAVICIGFIIGFQHRFRSFWWMIPVFWGSFALMQMQFPQYNFHDYSTPLFLMLLGAFFIFRRSRYGFGRQYRNDWHNMKNDWRNNNAYRSGFTSDTENGEYIDSTSIFGGAKKVIVSKNFKGGDITCFMGGAEIDLTQADIQGKAVLDVTAVFGGAKITVPSNWDVKIEINAAFGGVEDKRKFQTVAVDTSKVLVLQGTAVFGGIEIRNY